MTTRSESKNKSKHEEIRTDLSENSYNGIYLTPDIDINIACEVCTTKLKGKCGMGRNRKPKKSLLLKQTYANKDRL